MRKLKGEKTSRYLGVSWNTPTASWRFSIRNGPRTYSLAHFATEEEAAVVWDRLALYLRGPDTKVNFPRRKLKPANFEELTRERRKERTTSRYRGVARDWSVSGLKWLSQLQVNETLYMLGRYATERAAAEAYDRAAVHYIGKGAKLNFPKSKPAPANDKALQAHARAEHKKTTASKYRGVSRHHSGHWAAKIGHEYRKVHIGVFLSEEEAAEAYDKAARRLHGNAARLNFPED